MKYQGKQYRKLGKGEIVQAGDLQELNEDGRIYRLKQDPRHVVGAVFNNDRAAWARYYRQEGVPFRG